MHGALQQKAVAVQQHSRQWKTGCMLNARDLPAGLNVVSSVSIVRFLTDSFAVCLTGRITDHVMPLALAVPEHVLAAPACASHPIT